MTDESISRDQRLDALIQASFLRESLESAKQQSNKYLALLPEGNLKEKHAELNKDIEAIQARFLATLTEAKQLLGAGIFQPSSD